ncbi:MAG TPA: hypothetical protein VIH28_07080 [Ignavibacteriaceae bacterium]
MTEKEQIKKRLIEVNINGFKWFVDNLKRKIYLDRELNGITDYNFLSEDEMAQLTNMLKYGRK